MFMHTLWIPIILVGLFFLVRWLARSSGAHPIRALQPGTGSLEILKQRYARGEIDRDEFERVKRDLEAI
jgi:putative membrane protein